MALRAIDALIAELGDVPAVYEHEWRIATPRRPIVVPGAIFKWYYVHRRGVRVPDEIDAEARGVIVSAAACSDWNLSYGLNFALLHYSTAYAYLITGVWRGYQELWERVYIKDLASADPFERLEPDAGDDPCACVWELGIICHERMAWHRYLFSDRTEEDKLAWLADMFEGRV